MGHADSPFVTLIYFRKVDVENYLDLNQMRFAFANNNFSTWYFPKSIGMNRIKSRCENIYIWFDSKTNGRAWLSYFLL